MGDTDFPTVMANGSREDAKKKASEWIAQRSGDSFYSQSGTDIPTGSMYSRSGSTDGSDISPYGFEEFGISPTLIR